MTPVAYPSFDDLVRLYRSKVAVQSGEGLYVLLNRQGVESVLSFMRHDGYYPDFCSKLNHLVFSLCAGHFFSDGNKRIALVMGIDFLFRNGYRMQARHGMPRLEAIVYHVAAGHIDKPLLGRIIPCIVEMRDYDEELKLQLLHAIGSES